MGFSLVGQELFRGIHNCLLSLAVPRPRWTTATVSKPNRRACGGRRPARLTCGLCTGVLQPGLQFSAQVLEVAGAAARQLLAGVVEEDP